MQNGPIIRGVNGCSNTHTGQHQYEVHCINSEWSLWCRTCGEGKSLRVVLEDYERLKAVIDKLPKTADGVPLTPSSVVYWRCNGTVWSGDVIYVERNRAIIIRQEGDMAGDQINIAASDLWSSSEAAKTEEANND